MVKGAIFDLDGTLLYTLEDLKDSVNFALKKSFGKISRALILCLAKLRKFNF